MTERPTKNVAASVHQRLKNHAAASGQVFNDLLQHYALERFLFRLSKSQHADLFQVMLYRGALNSRMKDFFDIWTLAQSLAFDGPVLAEAIRVTCERRATPVNPKPVAFEDESTTDDSNQKQWSAFRRRLRGTDAPKTFVDVVCAVERFLAPVADAVARDVVFNRRWKPGGPWA